MRLRDELANAFSVAQVVSTRLLTSSGRPLTKQWFRHLRTGSIPGF